MNIAIRYLSKTGNTKKLAEAVSEAVGVPAEVIDVPLEGDIDILFLGSAVYAFELDPALKAFLDSLGGNVKRIVNFSTAVMVSGTYSRVKKCLDGKDIVLDEREFHCKGSFKRFAKNRPNDDDLKAAKAFAAGIVGEQ